jgi:hypothetical protein
LGILPHLDLCRYLYQVKKIGKAKVVWSHGFNLHIRLNNCYIDMELLESTKI